MPRGAGRWFRHKSEAPVSIGFSIAQRSGRLKPVGFVQARRRVCIAGEIRAAEIIDIDCVGRNDVDARASFASLH